MFLADVMLMKLGKWLRILGVQCEFPEDVDDDKILFQSKKNKLTLLTMDRELAAKAKRLGVKVFLLPHTMQSVEEQLSATVKRFKLPLEDYKEKTLCTKCGAKLDVIDSKSVAEKIPADVAGRFDIVWQCKKCGQVYWEGGHWRRISETISRVRENVARKEPKGSD